MSLTDTQILHKPYLEHPMISPLCIEMLKPPTGHSGQPHAEQFLQPTKHDDQHRMQAIELNNVVKLKLH